MNSLKDYLYQARPDLVSKPNKEYSGKKEHMYVLNPSQEVDSDTQASAQQNLIFIKEVREIKQYIESYTRELYEKGYSATQIEEAVAILRTVIEIKRSKEQLSFEESPFNKLLKAVEALPTDIKKLIDNLVSKGKISIVDNLTYDRKKQLAAGKLKTLEQILQDKLNIYEENPFSALYDLGEIENRSIDVNSLDLLLNAVLGYPYSTLKQSEYWKNGAAEIPSLLIPGIELYIVDRQVRGRSKEFEVHVYLYLTGKGDNMSKLKLAFHQALSEYNDKQAN